MSMLVAVVIRARTRMARGAEWLTRFGKAVEFAAAPFNRPPTRAWIILSASLCFESFGRPWATSSR